MIAETSNEVMRISAPANSDDAKSAHLVEDAEIREQFLTSSIVPNTVRPASP